MMRWRSAVVALVVIIAITACVPPTIPAPTPPEAPPAPQKPTAEVERPPAPARPGLPEPVRVACQGPSIPGGPSIPFAAAEGDYFVERQIVVVGLREEIARVLEAIPELQLERISSTDLGRLSQWAPERLRRRKSIGPFPLERLADLSFDVYELPAGGRVDVGEALKRILEVSEGLRKDRRLRFGVLAEPNYLIGRAPVAVSGDPNSVEGSPVSASGGLAPSDLFWQQWAFVGKQGIALFTDPSAARRTSRYSGKGVLVGVFDTSPFPEPGGYRFTGWITPTLTLCVSHPTPVVAVSSPQAFIDVRDHGLFVSSLVHAVAPSAEIHLIRVLNAQNQGDLATLVRSLIGFLGFAADRSQLDDAVINLSLGVQVPPDLSAVGLPADLYGRLQAIGGPSGWRGEAAALEAVIDLASAIGVVVVAASGNDSDAARAIPAQVPARLPTVLGVAASNDRGGRACFSNAGDVAAPGGEGAPPCRPEEIASCSGDCPLALIGLSLSSPTGFVYWNGTSFAAPLASGVAALALEEMPPGTSSEDVRKRVSRGTVSVSGSALGAGRVDVACAMLPPADQPARCQP